MDFKKWKHKRHIRRTARENLNSYTTVYFYIDHILNRISGKIEQVDKTTLTIRHGRSSTHIWFEDIENIIVQD